MKTLLIVVSFLVIAVPTFGQSERPESIVIPVSGVGDVTDTRKTILQNSLEENLKEHFKLVPQEVFKKAQEKAFEELEYDECNEDQCIMLIQEMLQVENVFHLQIIVEGKDSQLSLSYRNLYEKMKVTDVCLGCGTFELNGKVGGLVDKLLEGSGEVLELSNIVNKGDITGVLFRIKIDNEWKWSEVGNYKENPKYEGEIKNSLPSGKGVLSHLDKIVYDGEWVKGEMQGMGINYYGNGGKYFGEIKNGLLHGIGTFYYSDNTKITGNFIDVDPGTLFLSSPDFIEMFLESHESNFKVYDKDGNPLNFK